MKVSCLFLVLAVLAASPSYGATYSVSNTNDSGLGSLRQALHDANATPGPHTIDITATGTIYLEDYLPTINQTGGLTINGPGAENLSISGSEMYRAFFVNAPGGTVDINDVTIATCSARGGQGGTGTYTGGGGAGLGGALYVRYGTVTVSGVAFNHNTARGGSSPRRHSAALSDGGGGGMGGDGSVGGGGFAGEGAHARGGGLSPDSDGAPGGFKGGPAAGDGTSGTGGDGGGGGGGYVGDAEHDNVGAGGGGIDGGNYETGSIYDPIKGGHGGYGGGGGAGLYGGRGGFGGGGGAGMYGANGGFGGGGGAGHHRGGAGGFGGGNGGYLWGGGGMGAGGAIFLQKGTHLTLRDCSFHSNRVYGGSGAADGAAIGEALFLGGDVTLEVAGTKTVTFSETLGGGNDGNAAGGMIKTGTGTLVLAAENSFVGGVTLREGIVSISEGNHLGESSGAVTFDGGILQITGTNVQDLETRTVNWDAPRIDLDIADAANVFTISQDLSGTLHKYGAGTLVLTGAHPGDTVIAGGTLRSDATLGTPGGQITINSGGTLDIGVSLSRVIRGEGTCLIRGGANNVLLGDLNSPTGVDFDGTLILGDADVGLMDTNEAQLGGHTTLAGGRLTTFYGLELKSGSSLEGFGGVYNNVTNHGTVTGTGSGLTFDGLVDGEGDFLGTVTFDGLYSPGNSPAQVTLGDPTFENTLLLEIGGTEPGDYDQLTILGTASLGGSLNVELINGFAPDYGDSFLLLNGGSLNGQFDRINLPALSDPSLQWLVNTSPDSLEVRVVPEPGMVVLLAIGGLALLRWKRK